MGGGKRYFADHELFRIALRPVCLVSLSSTKFEFAFYFRGFQLWFTPCCQRSSRHAPLFRIQWPHLASTGLNDLSLEALGHWLDFCLPTLQALPVLGVAVGQGIVFPLKTYRPDEQRLVRGRIAGKAGNRPLGALGLRFFKGEFGTHGWAVSVIMPKKAEQCSFLFVLLFIFKF